MDPAFRRRAELGVKLVFLALGLLTLAAMGWIVWQAGADGPTGEPLAQPIAFSHQHHVGDDGIDCRYCHTTVERQAFAGLPSTGICLSCHSQLYAHQPVLAALRRSLASGRPIAWQRVHRLPDFVYFNHAVHLSKGVACIECHGRVDQMPLTWRVAPLTMRWCVACHRDPAPHQHPPGQITAMPPAPAPLADPVADPLASWRRLHSRRRRTDCSTCHR